MNTPSNTPNFLILAGGSGTRFWPLSRRSNPKQCLELYGGKSMLEHTIDRVKVQSSRQNRYLVYGQHLVEKLEASDALSIIEPSARNTAPAIALGALIADHFDPGSPIVVLPSDHFVGDVDAFSSDITAAGKLALEGKIVTIGIPPTRPETGFGYIKKGPPISSGFHVERFVEKPDFTKAVQYLASGEYVWNAGMFVFTYDTLFAEIQKQLPEMVSGLTKIKEALSATSGASWEDVSTSVAGVIAAEFEKFERISIDFGIMERAENVAVLPASFPWSDLGHWAAMADVRQANAEGNIIHRDSEDNTFFHDAKNNIVSISSNRFVAVVGIDDVVLVETGDAILLIPKSKCQDVREVVAYAKENKPALI